MGSITCSAGIYLASAPEVFEGSNLAGKGLFGTGVYLGMMFRSIYKDQLPDREDERVSYERNQDDSDDDEDDDGGGGGPPGPIDPDDPGGLQIDNTLLIDEVELFLRDHEPVLVGANND